MIALSLLPADWSKKFMSAFRLNALAVLGFIMLTICNTASAQITPSVRLELDDSANRHTLGAHIYITPDPEQKLNAQTVLNRHMNNIRGKLNTSSLINFGIPTVPSWMVFSVTNNSSHKQWFLYFGKPTDGRLALVKRIFVYNSTSGEIFANSYNPKATPELTNVTGSAIAIEIEPQKTNTFVVFLDFEGPWPASITPELITQSAYLDELRLGSFVPLLYYLTLLSASGVFVALTILRRKTYYALSAFYFFFYLALMEALNLNYHVIFSHTAEIYAFAMCAHMCLGIWITMRAMGIKRDDTSQSRPYMMLMFLMAISGLANLIYFNPSFLLSYIVFYGPLILSSLSLAIIAIRETQQGRFGAPYIAASWLSMSAGLSITIIGVLSLYNYSIFSLFSYWIFVIIHALFFVFATIKKQELVAEQERQVKSREMREAYSLERLKQSKKSADQARLLRVIERERELMTELRERERQRTEQMRHAKETADEANRAKSAFLALVSHEIRTPMTGIMGMVRLLLDTKMAPAQSDYIMAIQKSGDTMIALLNDILDFEKIETGNMKLENIDFDLHKLVNGVVTLMSGYAGEKGLTLKSEIAYDTPVFVKGDPTRLRQVFLNLVNNAIKFTQAGSVTIRLRYVPLPKGTPGGTDYEIYFAIQDTGIGMPDHVQQNLFTPFMQADSSTSRKFGGTGLGLAICKSLIEAMGSAIQVTSEEGKGSTFFFTLQMHKGESVSERNEGRKSLTDLSRTTEPMEILVIEDNEMNRRVLFGLLDKLGHKPVLAESGEEALNILAQRNFNLIFTDIKLGGMSGLDTARTIRTMTDRTKAATPIIALTGNVQLNDIDTYYAANINGYIAKPIDPQKLADVIYRAHEGLFENPVSLPEISSAQSSSNATDTGTSQQSAKRAILGENAPAPQEISPLQQFISQTYPGSTAPMPQSAPAYAPHTAPADGAQPIPDYAQMDEHDLDLDFDSFEESIKIMEDRAESKKPAAPLFDINIIQELIKSLGKDTTIGLLEDYFKFADQICSALSLSRQDMNLPEIRNRAHELKGMAANFGVTSLSALAGQIEKLAKEEADLLEIEPLLNQIDSTNIQAQATLREWIDQQ